MSADEFLSDSHPVNQQEDEDNYNAAAAHYYQIACMQEDIEETEIIGILANTPSIPGGGLNENKNFL